MLAKKRPSSVLHISAPRSWHEPPNWRRNALPARPQFQQRGLANGQKPTTRRRGSAAPLRHFISRRPMHPAPPARGRQAARQVWPLMRRPPLQREERRCARRPTPRQSYESGPTFAQAQHATTLAQRLPGVLACRRPWTPRFWKGVRTLSYSPLLSAVTRCAPLNPGSLVRPSRHTTTSPPPPSDIEGPCSSRADLR